MDNDLAILAFGALAQRTRLDAFKTLIALEPEGLAAGDLARRLDVPQNSLSSHLAILSRAGMVTSERRSRSIVYRADVSQLKALMVFFEGLRRHR